ncbi:cytosine deaminase [Acidisoma cellulosilytica]|uniref:Cytosine deaminase n=1 Tax=Acidisoma cellulosilyticum TaxID=2802395 RepID=A0A963Z3Z4_9PROT|nr:cytosine deaminase [Acidisoma cellulosilyticum]MCB8881600.1 cytosine deaminase [Acidisoma cellulosilyticum]
MTGFAIPTTSTFWLRRAAIPAGTLSVDAAASLGEPRHGYLYDADILIENGRIAAIEPAGTVGEGTDLQSRIVFPTFVDMHTHLDKGHVVARTPNPDGSFTGALTATGADRAAYWTAEDIALRMDFGLRCAFAHGVGAIRTHLDSFAEQAEISWGVFRDMRARWQGKIALQAVALTTIDQYDTPFGADLAALVARSGGILGAVTRMSGVDHGAIVEIDRLLDLLFAQAKRYGLDVDLHVDETDDVAAFTLPRIAAAIERNDFTGKVTCGHCCNLALQPDSVAAETIAHLARLGVTVVSLPSANMYLQDRHAGRTPRWRGVTLAHELKAAGVPFAFATDNCRDAFVPYGDHDTLDSFRFALRVSHLDHPYGDWAGAITQVPATTMGLTDCGLIAVARTADLVLTRARSFDEITSRPQADRVVLRGGKVIDQTLPDYAELDGLTEAAPRTLAGPSAA